MHTCTCIASNAGCTDVQAHVCIMYMYMYACFQCMNIKPMQKKRGGGCNLFLILFTVSKKNSGQALLHTCTYIALNACTCTYVHVYCIKCIYMHVCTYIHVKFQLYVYTCMYLYKKKSAQILLRTCTYMALNACTCIYVHVYCIKCIYMHLCTYVHV